MNNLLREYPYPERLSFGLRRFQLFEDNTKPPFAHYDTLAEALKALLLADAKTSIEAQWKARFGG